MAHRKRIQVKIGEEYRIDTDRVMVFEIPCREYVDEPEIRLVEYSTRDGVHTINDICEGVYDTIAWMVDNRFGILIGFKKLQGA